MSVNIGTIRIEGMRPKRIAGSELCELEFTHENGQRFFIRVQAAAIDDLAREAGEDATWSKRYRLLIEPTT